MSETVADWHAEFSTDKAVVRAWLADVFFAGTVDALFTSIFSLLDKHAVSKDSPAKFSLPGEYTTNQVAQQVVSEVDLATCALSCRFGKLHDASCLVSLNLSCNPFP